MATELIHKKIGIIIIGCILFLASCSKPKGGLNGLLVHNLHVERKTSILNGDVEFQYELTPDGEYGYDRQGRLSKMIVKKEYTDGNIFDANFSIYILNDTLNIGDTFTGVVWTRSGTRKVRLKAPVNKDTATVEGSFRLLFPCEKSGIQRFSGTLLLDEKEIHFEYRFLVLNK